MPFGFWVLGNSAERSGDLHGLPQVSNAFRLLGSGEPKQALARRYQAKTSQMPFGFWVLGNPPLPIIKKLAEITSQMPFGFWVLGNLRSKSSTELLFPSLKCLSAFGFWGTLLKTPKQWAQRAVSNAFRLLGSGELSPTTLNTKERTMCLKCLSAFGFWGTQWAQRAASDFPSICLKCLSAFGFWGTQWNLLPSCWWQSQVSNAFRLLGSGERHHLFCVCLCSTQVSNAFRLLGSGEHPSRNTACPSESPRLKCLSAFGFWGTDIRDEVDDEGFGASQMPFGFWVLGNLQQAIVNLYK